MAGSRTGVRRDRYASRSTRLRAKLVGNLSESISHFIVAKEHKFVRAMSKRKSYDVSFKLKAVECAGKKSKEAAAS